jgi:hypothetical protein
MKKIFTFIVILTAIKITAQPNYYYQYFEPNSSNNLNVAIGTNTDNIWQIGTPTKTLFSSANSFPSAIITLTSGAYPVSNVSSFSFAVAHYTWCSFCPYALQWTQKLDMEAGKDGGIVEFSIDGQNWQNTLNNPNIYQFYGFQPANKDTINGNEYCFSGTDNSWRSIWLCLPGTVINGNDSIWYRFTFKSDANQTNQEGWVMDNFNAHYTPMHPVKQNGKPDQTTIYPNITNGIVNVEWKKKNPTNQIDNIKLTDLNGKVIEDYGANYSKVVLDLSKHPQGAYFITVTIGKEQETHTVIYAKE